MSHFLVVPSLLSNLFLHTLKYLPKFVSSWQNGPVEDDPKALMR
jgi:hypothetical protein